MKVAGITFEVVSTSDPARAKLIVAQWLCDNGIRSGETLRFARTALDFTAVDLAKLMFVTPETMSRWENDHREVPVMTFALVGALVSDRLHGRKDTMQVLAALHTRNKPGTKPPKVIHLGE